MPLDGGLGVIASAVNATVHVSQLIYNLRGVDEQAKDFIQTTNHVAAALDKVQNLRRQKASSLPIHQTQWIDEVCKDTEVVLNDVRALIEPARVDMETRPNGRVSLINSGLFVLRDSQKVASSLARLGLVNQSLNSTMITLCLRDNGSSATINSLDAASVSSREAPKSPPTYDESEFINRRRSSQPLKPSPLHNITSETHSDSPTKPTPGPSPQTEMKSMAVRDGYREADSKPRPEKVLDPSPNDGSGSQDRTTGTNTGSHQNSSPNLGDPGSLEVVHEEAGGTITHSQNIEGSRFLSHERTLKTSTSSSSFSQLGISPNSTGNTGSVYENQSAPWYQGQSTRSLSPVPSHDHFPGFPRARTISSTSSISFEGSDGLQAVGDHTPSSHRPEVYEEPEFLNRRRPPRECGYPQGRIVRSHHAKRRYSAQRPLQSFPENDPGPIYEMDGSQSKSPCASELDGTQSPRSSETDGTQSPGASTRDKSANDKGGNTGFYMLSDSYDHAYRASQSTSSSILTLSGLGPSVEEWSSVLSLELRQ